MWQDRRADREIRVDVGGHAVVAYEFGSGPDVLLCLNGGPGLPCDYFREALSFLAEHGFRVVAFDQLGCGASDRPEDPALWSITRYVAEVEAVRAALGLGRVHLTGHSWGGWLAIEYALTHPQNVRTLLLQNTAADLPHLMSELHRLRAALGPEAVAMMAAHEAAGRFTHPEYQAAITLLNYRHVLRLEGDWPAPVLRSLGDWNMAPYKAMQGPNEFLYIGNLKDWTRLDDLPSLHVPALITVGAHDEQTPACATRMAERLPQAELHLFAHSSHMPFYEEPEAFDRVLLSFLTRHRAA
ncbi:proline iminopeptidase [Azorhizobium oxalatiphilum]|uniref:Proline iminopeptidase n=1 Tax=Azorhizobium oxalatiphilum TaxID=980631 RepID=A0A917FER4_9HYPH|nr:proline iminopeptidase-family hydrolase [Azorhizobium oxalatiphilum]GGF70838.1 proline iminopeptidase [Azorhizobium oxalatiphilum]